MTTRAPDSHDFVVMPKALTAENGAKALFMSAFSERIGISCGRCNGSGFYDELETDICDDCDGAGSYYLKVEVSWTTIKEIYAMAVRELGKGPAAK